MGVPVSNCDDVLQKLDLTDAKNKKASQIFPGNETETGDRIGTAESSEIIGPGMNPQTGWTLFGIKEFKAYASGIYGVRDVCHRIEPYF